MNPSFPVLLHIYHFLLVNPTPSFLPSAPSSSPMLPLLPPGPSQVHPQYFHYLEFSLSASSSSPGLPLSPIQSPSLVISSSPILLQCSQFLYSAPSSCQSSSLSQVPFWKYQFPPQCSLFLAVPYTACPLPSAFQYPPVLVHPSQSFPVPYRTSQYHPRPSQTPPVSPDTPQFLPLLSPTSLCGLRVRG